jgi:hypothetical protein
LLEEESLKKYPERHFTCILTNLGGKRAGIGNCRLKDRKRETETGDIKERKREREAKERYS